MQGYHYAYYLPIRKADKKMKTVRCCNVCPPKNHSVIKLPIAKWNFDCPYIPNLQKTKLLQNIPI